MSTIADLVKGARGSGPSGVRSAARLMSILADQPHRLPEVYHAAASTEDAGPEWDLLPRLLVGVTGPPGSGKSTLTDALVRAWRERHPDRRVGVVAVDPSSPFTGGAVLGDRVRMMRHATDPMVFVRSMASRGHLGGLALGVKGVVRVLGLIGCDVVFVETVGVGQSEVEVAGLADLVMIVLAPGQGDSVQLLKAGLMEIGDFFVVNKADRPDAGTLHSELLAMLRAAGSGSADHHGVHSRDASASDRPGTGEGGDAEDYPLPLLTRRPGAAMEPGTFLVSAEKGTGVVALAEGLERYEREHGHLWVSARRKMIEEEVREAVLEEARDQLRATLRSADAPVVGVLEGTLPVSEAARRLLAETCRRQGR
jgi:LAO/AO transport system ATPase